jgi:hypothetical protein
MKANLVEKLSVGVVLTPKRPIEITSQVILVHLRRRNFRYLHGAIRFKASL